MYFLRKLYIFCSRIETKQSSSKKKKHIYLFYLTVIIDLFQTFSMFIGHRSLLGTDLSSFIKIDS